MAKLSIVGVQAVKAFEGLESLDVNITGTVVPFRQVKFGAEIAGRVQFKSDNCRIGRFVQNGDLLFNIDPTDFKLEKELKRLESFLKSVRQSTVCRSSFRNVAKSRQSSR